MDLERRRIVIGRRGKLGQPLVELAVKDNIEHVFDISKVYRLP
ncbi:MAG TPA: hypothetical protein VNA67_09370 [Pseudonocardiaceae bacterium]|nr:hypothetical protein [Pseudonocardiaceae bacterium]